MKTKGQVENTGESELGLSHPPGDGSGSASGYESPALEIERSSPQRLAGKKVSATSLARRITGPRTPQGKERSKSNALKHGIFSEAVVLKGESHAEYQSLLKGLQEAFRPEGKLEETLVEKLATVLWRHRRLIVAEGAEIRKNIEFLEWDQREQQREEALEIGKSPTLEDVLGEEDKAGLVWKMQNPEVLERCLELLAELQKSIEANGFLPDDDAEVLKIIYGTSGQHRLRETVYGVYETWVNTAAASEVEREGYASPEECKENVLREIDAEIRRLKRYQKVHAAVEANRTKLELLRQGVPDSPTLDRLLRYEASLERAFDRALSQLERLQRMRLGQPVPPPVKVQLSS